MKRVLIGLGAVAWFCLLFLVTFTLLFPSDAVVERLRWEVQERSGDQYAMTMDSVGPWWLGASAQDVKIYAAPRRGAPKELAYLAKDLRGAVSPLSAVTGAPRVSGSITPIVGTIYYTVGTGRVGKKKNPDLSVTELNVEADDFPMSELMLLGGLPGNALGGVDFKVELDGSEGMRTANGAIQLQAANLMLTDLEIPGVGPLGMELPLDEVSMHIKVDEGEAKFVRGDIRSPLLTAEVGGSVRLRDDLARSKVDVEIMLSNLGDKLKMFESFLTQGDVGGGKFRVQCTGTLSSPGCMLSKSAVSSRASSRRGSRRTTPRASRGSSDDDDAGSSRRAERPDADELKRRREERLERLRRLREERAEEREDRDMEDEPEEEDPPEDDFEDEEEFDDEEFLDDDEEFLDDEEEFIE